MALILSSIILVDRDSQLGLEHSISGSKPCLLSLVYLRPSPKAKSSELNFLGGGFFVNQAMRSFNHSAKGGVNVCVYCEYSLSRDTAMVPHIARPGWPGRGECNARCPLLRMTLK